MPGGNSDSLAYLQRACDADRVYCAGLGIRQLEEARSTFRSYGNDAPTERDALENLERGCRNDRSIDDRRAEACILAGQLQEDGVLGRHEGNARGSYGTACRSENDDEACMLLADLLVNRFSQKSAHGEALELYRQSCRRGNDEACDRVARFTDY